MGERREKGAWRRLGAKGQGRARVSEKERLLVYWALVGRLSLGFVFFLLLFFSFLISKYILNNPKIYSN
jgi:hypothetical protein